MQKATRYMLITALAAVFCLAADAVWARSSVHMGHTDQTVPHPQGAMHPAPYSQATIPSASGAASANPAGESTGMWDKTKEVSADVWKGTKEVGTDVWDGTKKVTGDVWDGAKKLGSDVSDAVSGDGGAPTSNPPAAHPDSN